MQNKQGNLFCRALSGDPDEQEFWPIYGSLMKFAIDTIL